MREESLVGPLKGSKGTSFRETIVKSTVQLS